LWEESVLESRFLKIRWVPGVRFFFCPYSNDNSNCKKPNLRGHFLKCGFPGKHLDWRKVVAVGGKCWMFFTRAFSMLSEHNLLYKAESSSAACSKRWKDGSSANSLPTQSICMAAMHVALRGAETTELPGSCRWPLSEVLNPPPPPAIAAEILGCVWSPCPAIAVTHGGHC
jgi:hypothetical protein